MYSVCKRCNATLSVTKCIYDAYAVSIVPLDTAQIFAEHDFTFILLPGWVFFEEKKERKKNTEKKLSMGQRLVGNSF